MDHKNKRTAVCISSVTSGEGKISACELNKFLSSFWFSLPSPEVEISEKNHGGRSQAEIYRELSVRKLRLIVFGYFCGISGPSDFQGTKG